MSDMDKLISSEKLIHDLSGIRDTLPDIFLKNVMSAAISCVEKQPEALSDNVIDRKSDENPRDVNIRHCFGCSIY